MPSIQTLTIRAALSALVLAAALPLRAQSPANRPELPGRFVADSKGCLIWNQAPEQLDLGRWTGACEHGKANGVGLLEWRKGGELLVAYRGALLEGKMSGAGDYRTVDGVHYVGMFEDDNFNGQGTLILPSGERYSGDFLNGERTGTGATVWPNGNRYEGHYLNGLAQGEGKKTWASGESYVGAWDGGHMNGAGSYTRANGDRIVGEFLRDQPHDGYVEYYWADGRRYSGLVVRGKPNGRGTYTLPSGERFEGQWTQGVLKIGDRVVSIE